LFLPSPPGNERQRVIKAGFIGLGNIGSKLAGSLVRNRLDVSAYDLDADAMAPLQAARRQWPPDRPT
jgi:3-hydroxyisobutyrate dehydrogenase-like beta-hydroxyacid dehydrogenase